MVRKQTPNFAEVSDVEEEAVVIEEPTVITNANDGLVKARVKGTWKMFWGQASYDFEDGKSYKLPSDLFNYLRKNGNIYDTMS
jgi:hypothetical protein